MRKRLAMFGIFTSIIATIAVTFQPASAATGVMDDAIYQITRPSTGSSLTTPYATEAESAARLYGFSELDTTFLVSYDSGVGLVAAKRLYHPTALDWVTESDPTRISQAVAAGYINQGTRYYVSSVDTTTTEPVYRFVKNGKHVYAMSPSDISAYIANGYINEGISYYAVPTAADRPQFANPTPPTSPSPVTDGVFSIAVMGDTQNLSYIGGFGLYKAQMDDIVQRKSTHDLRFAVSVGDVVSDGINSYDTNRDPGQVSRAVESFKRLSTGGVPYLIAAGNHDTAAVCRGGSACPANIGDGLISNQRVRDTRLLSEPLYSSIAPEKSYQSGRFENSYKTFRAEGTDWMVISVELWARRGALDWAKAQIAAHPRHNIVVVSHMLVNSDGSIASGNGGYGNLASNVMVHELGSYPNVKLMLSGHVGTGTGCKDITATFSGKTNKLLGCSTAFHGGTWNPNSDFNPVRFLAINVNNGTVSSSIRTSAKRAGSTSVRPNYESLDKTYTIPQIIK